MWQGIINMKTELSIETIMHGDGAVVLTLHGSVDLQTSPRLFTTLMTLFADTVSSVLVDLSAVAVIDSSGIATLVEGLNWSHKSGGSFRLTGVSDRVRDAFGLAKLEQEFTIV